MARLFGQNNCLTDDQEEVLGITQDFSCKIVNTCGTETSLLEYEVYDPAKPEGYEEGIRVLYPAEGGKLILLVEALEDINPPVGDLDLGKWLEVCRKQTTDLSYLPEYTELTSLYEYYNEQAVYSQHDVVLKDSGCSDYACVLVGTGTPLVWKVLYCVLTGRKNSCKKIKKCGSGRVLVSLSNQDNDLICAPDPRYAVESKGEAGSSNE